MTMTPTVHDIFYNETLGPNVLSRMTREQKVRVLRMMNKIHPKLVKYYLRLLFSATVVWDNDQRHGLTGLPQERISLPASGTKTLILVN